MVGKVLILGGYGTFGGRLAMLLADEARLTLVIAGRSLASAEAFCARVKGPATVRPAAFDRTGDVERQLREIAPDLVVDATGPFQAYGTDPYRVVRAAIALGIHYLDLADGASFVKGIAEFDEAARRRGVFVLSGVSSFPVLTAAVVRRLIAFSDRNGSPLSRVETITGGIAPSPFANVGLNVIRAIASYAGKPVTLLRNGRSASGRALIESVYFTVAPPGRLPLQRRRFSLVDVPDHQLLPALWPGLSAVWMGAGPVPEIWHRALSALSWLVRLKIVPSLEPLAGLMHRTVNRLSFGDHRGGMFVSVAGELSNGTKVERSWHMLAEGDDGPLIPSMAAEAIIRRCLAGSAPESGSRAATADLELADYEAMFSRWKIATGTREAMRAAEGAPLYRRLLGSAYEALPGPLQIMHDLERDLTAEGVATVERGTGVLSRLAAGIVGFPPARENIPLVVTFRSRGHREYWHRSFAGCDFESVQEEGRGRNERLLCERFGPVNFAMALVLDGSKLTLVLRRWTLFGIPLPLALAPRIDAFEFAEGGRFCFHVEIRHPLVGLIVAYRGWLVPRPQSAPGAN